MKFNNLTDWHKDLLNLMIGSTFQGKDEIKVQIYESEYEIIDSNNSLKITCKNSPSAKIKSTIPVEVESIDSDETIIHGLLFVSKDGLIYMLEIFREDGLPVLKLPKVNDFKVITN